MERKEEERMSTATTDEHKEWSTLGEWRKLQEQAEKLQQQQDSEKRLGTNQQRKPLQNTSVETEYAATLGQTSVQEERGTSRS